MKKILAVSVTTLLMAGTGAVYATSADAATSHITAKSVKAGKKCKHPGKTVVTRAGKFKCKKSHGKYRWKRVHHKSGAISLPPAVALPVVHAGS